MNYKCICILIFEILQRNFSMKCTDILYTEEYWSVLCLLILPSSLGKLKTRQYCFSLLSVLKRVENLLQMLKGKNNFGTKITVHV